MDDRRVLLISGGLRAHVVRRPKNTLRIERPLLELRG